MAKRKTNEQFLIELKAVNENIEILTPYVKASINVLCRCKRCGYEWSPFPSSLLRMHGCRLCSKKKSAEKRKRSNEDFLKELKEKNPRVVPLESYSTCNKKIHCKCACGNDNWYPTPSALLQGSLCVECVGNRVAKKNMKSEDVFRKELEQNNPYVEIIGKYNGIDRRVECRCKRCGHVWSPFASFVYRGGGCAICAGVKKLSQVEFERRVHLKFPNI